jgi:hypothetical protein
MGEAQAVLASPLETSGFHIHSVTRASQEE